MSSLEESFNRSGVSIFLNKPAGRIFRICAGIGFIMVGYLFRDHVLGIGSILWGGLPLSAGAFDICYVSLVLGGPISGEKIREKQRNR